MKIKNIGVEVENQPIKKGKQKRKKEKLKKTKKNQKLNVVR